MTDNNNSSAEAWLHGQRKVKKSFNREAYEKYWREQNKDVVVQVDEEEIKEHLIKVLDKNRKV